MVTIHISKYGHGNGGWLECIFWVQISKYGDEVKNGEWLRCTDCWNVFLSEKTKLKSILANVPGRIRICLTSDVWIDVTTLGYMIVISHYVGKWKLNSELLALCGLESSHTLMELYGKVFGVLKDWGIVKLGKKLNFPE